VSTPKDPRGNRYPHLDRPAIARAALALVDREGAAALTVRRLAAELGVAAMTLYHYIPSREAVVADVVGLVVDEMDLSVAPGLTETEGTVASPHANAFDFVQMLQAIPRRGLASDIAPAVSFLCSEEAAWVTGSMLVVDGGHTRH